MSPWTETVIDVVALTLLTTGFRAILGMPPISANSITFAVATLALLTANRANRRSRP